MSICNLVGDLYHQHVYRYIARGTSTITDSIDCAITDTLLGFTLFLPELIVGGSAYFAYRLTESVDFSNNTEALSRLLSTFSGAAIVVGIGVVTYGLNFIRTPLEKRLNIRIPENLVEDEEVNYTIKRLSELSESPANSFEQINGKINKAIDEFVINTEGYNVRHSRKIKLSIFSKYLLRRGCGGTLNPFIQEVIVTSKLFPESIAHEKAHLVGYARESEAEFVGHAAMLKSNDHLLQYLAYVQRMRGLQTVYNLSLDDLEKRGLNSRTLEELRSRNNVLDEEYAKNSRYRKFLIGIGIRARSLMLRLFGQRNVRYDYLDRPLSMISAYDPPRPIRND